MRYSTELVKPIAEALRQDSAGNKQATMTDLDFAASMLSSLADERDHLRIAKNGITGLRDALLKALKSLVMTMRIETDMQVQQDELDAAEQVIAAAELTANLHDTETALLRIANRVGSVHDGRKSSCEKGIIDKFRETASQRDELLAALELLTSPSMSGSRGRETYIGWQSGEGLSAADRVVIARAAIARAKGGAQ